MKINLLKQWNYLRGLNELEHLDVVILELFVNILRI